MIEDIKKNEISAQELDEELDEINGGELVNMKIRRNNYICERCNSILKSNEISKRRCSTCGALLYTPRRKRK